MEFLAGPLVGIGVGQRAGGVEAAAEGIVGVGGEGGVAGAEEVGDIAVGVGKIPSAAAPGGEGQQAADASGVLEAAAEIESACELVHGRGIAGRLAEPLEFLDGNEAVVNVADGFGACGVFEFAGFDAAAESVVEELAAFGAFDNAREPVLFVVTEGAPLPVGDEIAVVVVLGVDDALSARDGLVLVEGVGGISGVCAGAADGLAVADAIIGVGEISRGKAGGTGEFANAVVSKGEVAARPGLGAALSGGVVVVSKRIERLPGGGLERRASNAPEGIAGIDGGGAGGRIYAADPARAGLVVVNKGSAGDGIRDRAQAREAVVLITHGSLRERGAGECEGFPLAASVVGDGERAVGEGLGRRDRAIPRVGDPCGIARAIGQRGETPGGVVAEVHVWIGRVINAGDTTEGIVVVIRRAIARIAACFEISHSVASIDIRFAVGVGFFGLPSVTFYLMGPLDFMRKETTMTWAWISPRLPGGSPSTMTSTVYQLEL